MKHFLKNILRLIDRHPLKILVLLLILLLGIIYLGAKIRAPEEVAEEEVSPKKVDLYEVGSVPLVAAEVEIEKQGILTIVAQVPGIVNKINVLEGDEVKRNQTLISIGSTYGGGSTFVAQRDIAQAQYDNLQKTYNIQKGLFGEQKELARTADTNTDALREITAASVQETKDLIDLNQEIIFSFDDYLQNLDNHYIEDPRGDLLLYAKQMKLQYDGVDQEISDRYDDYIEDLESYDNIDPRSDLVLYTRQMKSQFTASLNSLRAGLRQSEYQADPESPGAMISDLQKNITLEQIELQEKALDLGLEISRLQLRLAETAWAQANPAAPFTGRLEHVHVQAGDNVNPGTPLFTFAAEEKDLKAIAYISQSFKDRISSLDATHLVVGNNELKLYPSYISREAVKDNLYAVTYSIPREYYGYYADKARIKAYIPIGYPDTLDTIPFIPIDAVYQTAESAFVYLFEEGKVVSREIEIGPIFGGFVEVKQGLDREDRLILNRNVFAGDKVEFISKEGEK